MKGKSVLMAGVAAVALVAMGQAGFAAKKAADKKAVDAPATAAAQAPAQSGPTNAELAARIQALEDAMQTTETKAQSDHSRLSALEQNVNDTVVSFSNARPTITSGDGRFSMAIRVRFQSDVASFMQDNPAATSNTAEYKDLSSGSVIRRAFLGVEGKAFDDFWYEFRYNAGGSQAETGGTNSSVLSIARIAYTGIPHLRVNLGVIEPAFTLEGTTSSGQLMFMERPSIDAIATGTYGGGDGRRGVELAYQYENLFLPGDNFVLTGAVTGSTVGTTATHGNGNDEPLQYLGRLSYRVWSDGVSNVVLGFSGASADTMSKAATFNLGDTPEIRVDNTKLISTGSIAARHSSMYAFDGSLNIENFYLAGEYANFEVDRMPSTTAAVNGGHPNFSGWYVEGSWILTGETKGYNVNATNNEIGGWAGPKVARPFSWSGDSWGAWELVARYSNTDLNWHPDLVTGIRGGEQKIFTVGVNWYLNNVVRLGLYDEVVSVDKSKAYNDYTKLGQDMNVFGLRLQFSN